jgi:outer membrane protein assembly factor BamB
MRFFAAFILTAFAFSSLAAEISADDWPTWRGPSTNGIAADGQTPPTEFGPDKNVVWSAPVPGRGHGSAIVVGNQVILAIADDKAQTQGLISYDRATGKEQWRCELHQGGFPKKINANATHASSTPACDGERIYISFMNHGAVHTSAVSMDGKKIWQKTINKYVVHQGYGTSPLVYKDLVLISSDTKIGGVLCALKRSDGSEMWRVQRPKEPTYTSPVIVNAAGREQLVYTGCYLVTSLDPATGKKLWETKGATRECVTTTTTDGTHVFASGGWPRNHVEAYLADGSGKLVWGNSSRVYVPSMICKDGYLYATMDAGFAVCWKSDTGKEMWKGRLGGDLKASPTLANGHIYSPNERGEVFVFKPSPEKFEIVATNKVGNKILAMPAICGSRIYLRVATNKNGKRSEMLYCWGK